MKIDVLDKADATIFRGLRSGETKIKIVDLPYFAHFTVKVKAVYDDFDDSVESAEVQEIVATGTEGACGFDASDLAKTQCRIDGAVRWIRC